jgi:hypothetical protein
MAAKRPRDETSGDDGDGATQNTVVARPQFVWWKMVINMATETVETMDLQAVLNVEAHDWVFQKEVGASGTPHYQCNFRLKKKKRLHEVLEMFSPLVSDVRAIQLKPSDKKFSDYCQKEDSRVDGPWWSKSMLPPVKVKDPLEGKELYPWQRSVVDLIASPVNDRTINWYWEPIGNRGKSALMKHIAMTTDAMVLGTCEERDIYKAIVDRPVKPTIVLVDIPRSGVLSVNLMRGLENVKNGLIFSSKYEPIQAVFNPPHVIVFANHPPPPDCWSADRYATVEIA